MLEKILGKVSKGLIMLGTMGLIYGCEDECMAPMNIAYESVEQVQSVEQPIEKAIIGETETETQSFYLMATCPPGCTYDSGVGCCWCPN